MLDIHATTTVAFTVAVEGDEFRFTDVNAAAVEHSGIAREDQIGRRPQESLPATLATKVLAHYRTCASSNLPVVYETEFVFPNGYYFWRTTLVPFISTDSGKVSSLLGFCQDCTQQKINERLKETFHEKLSLAIGAIDGGFWVYEIASEHFETSRPLAELIAGPGRTTLNLAEYASYIHVDDLNPREIMHPDSDRSSAQYRVITHEGRTRWLQSKRQVVRDEAGAAVKVVGLVVDITEQKTTLRTLEAEASTDALTSLKNRRAFDRIATQVIRAAPDSGETVALVLIDLDGFKPVNDRYGHRAGDEILRKVGRRLVRQVHESVTLARIGGDEFAILVRRATPDAAAALATRITQAFSKPFLHEGASIVVGVSVGTALSGERGSPLADLFNRADRSLYASKTARRRQAGPASAETECAYKALQRCKLARADAV